MKFLSPSVIGALLGGVVAAAEEAVLDPYDQSGVPIEVDAPALTAAPRVSGRGLRAEPMPKPPIKIVLVAGRPSHGPGDHEHFAGMAILFRMLQQNGVWPVLAREGWPKNEKIFDGAAAIVFYADGGGGHPAIQRKRLALLDGFMKQGVGLACIHYAVEVPKERGGAEFLRWLGGYFETHWSVNPWWEADFKQLPQHPITRGVQPFKILDEWYYHMRFGEDKKGVTPILSAHPPKETLNRPDGEHSGNPHVRAAIARGEIQHVAWAFQRPLQEGGGRGFGFTGAHRHVNWGNENFRRLVTNALLWVARAPVPRQGADVTMDPADLRRNLDDKRPRP